MTQPSKKTLTFDFEPTGGEFHCAKVHHLVERDEDGHALSPNHDRIDRLCSRLSGWHFAKESLTVEEREILYVAEQLMATLDRLSGGYLR